MHRRGLMRLEIVFLFYLKKVKRAFFSVFLLHNIYLRLLNLGAAQFFFSIFCKIHQPRYLKLAVTFCGLLLFQSCILRVASCQIPQLKKKPVSSQGIGFQVINF